MNLSKPSTIQLETSTACQLNKCLFCKTAQEKTHKKLGKMLLSFESFQKRKAYNRYKKDLKTLIYLSSRVLGDKL